MVRRIIAALATLAALVTAGALPADAAATYASRITAAFSSATVTAGARTYARGALTPGTGRTVALQRLSGTKWVTVASTKTNSRGGYTIATSNRTRGGHTYRLTAAAAGRYRSTTSATVRLNVNAATAMTFWSPSTAAVGTTQWAGGTITGATPLTRTVTLQRLTGRTWASVATTRADAKGNYAFQLPAHGRGTYQYRARAGAVSYGNGATGPARASTYVYPVKTALTTSKPPARVYAHVPLTITGQVPTYTTQRRPIALQVWREGPGWVTVARTTSTSTGRFAFRIPTSATGSYGYRFQAAAAGRTPELTVLYFALGVDAVPTTVTITGIPSSATYRATATLTGKLTGGAGLARTLYLQRRDGATWLYVVAGQSSSSGAFTLSVPTGTLGTFDYRVLTTAGGTGAQGLSATRRFTVNGTPSPVTLAATPTSVPASTRVTLTGTLAGAYPAWRDVTLERLTGTRWSRVDTVTTGAVGEFAFTLPTTALGTTSYRVHVPALGTQAATVTATRTLTVTAATATVTLDAGPGTVFTGTSAALTGTLTGAGAVTRPIRLERLTGTTWSVVATAATDATGSFALPVSTAVAGTTTYRVVAPATATAAAATSPSRTVTVTSTVGPAALVVGADLHTVTAVRTPGGTSTVYSTPSMITGPVAATGTHVAATEWDPDTGREEVWVGTASTRARAYAVPQGACVSWVRLAPNAQYLLVAQGSGSVSGPACDTTTVLLVTTATAATAAVLTDPGTAPAAAAAFSPDSTRAALAWRDSATGVVVVDTATAAPVNLSASLVDLAGVRDLWWTARGLTTAADTGDGYQLFHTDGSTTAGVLPGLTGAARSAAVSADGSTLVWETRDPATPVLLRAPMRYDANPELTGTAAGPGVAGVEPATLEVVGSGYVAVTGDDGASQLRTLAGQTLWTGRAIGYRP